MTTTDAAAVLLLVDIRTTLAEARKRLAEALAGEGLPADNYEWFRLHLRSLEKKVDALELLMEASS